MQPIVNTSTKALSPDCGMVAGVLRDLRIIPSDGEIVRASIEYTCPYCGCSEASTVIPLPLDMLVELQPLVGQACRICRDGERYIVRGEAL